LHLLAVGVGLLSPVLSLQRGRVSPNCGAVGIDIAELVANRHVFS